MLSFPVNEEETSDKNVPLNKDISEVKSLLIIDKE